MKYGKSKNYIYGNHKDDPAQYPDEDFDSYVVDKSTLPALLCFEYGREVVDTLLFDGGSVDIYEIHGKYTGRVQLDNGMYFYLPVLSNTINPDAICLFALKI